MKNEPTTLSDQNIHVLLLAFFYTEVTFVTDDFLALQLPWTIHLRSWIYSKLFTVPQNSSKSASCWQSLALQRDRLRYGKSDCLTEQYKYDKTSKRWHTPKWQIQCPVVLSLPTIHSTPISSLVMTTLKSPETTLEIRRCLSGQVVIAPV